ncbi:MAG: RdgB/HAM1 family non-canonical purine NTP pyrophosphatase [Firmicutes bacterium]|nr:RdgB/HAM1 family non-canonical purine NTP pyrophosphatase [Bacillota bacterium]
MKLVAATFNRHKVEEISAILAPLGLSVQSLAEYTDKQPVEDGDSFEANALIKARYGYQLTGLPTIADDSGLEVDALSGAPGVHSARFAGENASDDDNNRKLLTLLADVPRSERKARFRCAIALVSGDDILTAEGSCEGEILTSPQGSGGFGYDPLFWLPQEGKSMAELPPEHKNQVSHRARALAELARVLKSRGWGQSR